MEIDIYGIVVTMVKINIIRYNNFRFPFSVFLLIRTKD